MSTNSEEEATDMMMCCASCGTAQVDDIKLKTCTACKSVRYCSIKCQKEHRPQHKRACKKRAAELHDEILFKQPESSHEGDCPICFLPISLDDKKSTRKSCCSKLICDGCYHSNEVRITRGSEPTCPFCRHPAPESEEEEEKNIMKRVKANDPAAMVSMSLRHYRSGDYDDAFRYVNKAAKLGDDARAHFQLARFYHGGQCVEKDGKKEVYHLEQAAIGGHPRARYNLGCEEMNNGRRGRAVKHWIIAATLGCDDSLDALKVCFRGGLVTKDDFAATLRVHQAAVEATKSPQREAAEEARKE
eukprot:scaffold7751_cov76-Skeletonema_dohrnii-CCMP3373.AAC.3